MLAGLASYRLARFVVDDSLFEKWRLKAHMRLFERGHLKLSEGLGCGYCVSVWFAVLLTARRRGWLRASLAASGVAAVAWSLDRLAVDTES